MNDQSKEKSYDAIVAGAGIAGLGAAIGLAEAGQKVLVVSTKNKGVSSLAAGGILDPFLEMAPGQPLFQLSQEAFRKYPALVKKIESKTGMKTGYKKTGMLYAALTSAEVKELQRRYEWQKKTGIPVKWLSRQEVLKKDPLVNPEVLAGLFYPTVARIHPKSFVSGLTAYAKKIGVRFITLKHSPKSVIRKGGFPALRCGKVFYKAGSIVNATGSWAMIRGAFSKLPVRPVKGEIVIVHSRNKISTILHSLDGGYIVPWNDKPLKGGAQEYLLGSTVEHVGFKPEPTPSGIKRILEKNIRIMPALKFSKRVTAWAGLRPFSEVKSPLIGPSKTKGVFLAAGYYRSGILIGCRAGELLAKGILSGKMPAVLKAFAPRRFSL